MKQNKTMRKTFIFLLLLLILNLIGNSIINNIFSDYHKVSGIINYFIILVIASFNYVGTLVNKKNIDLFLFPLIFLIFSLVIVMFDLVVEGPEYPSEMLFLMTSFFSSFFEFINYLIGDIQNNMLRKLFFIIFNSIGVSAIIFYLAVLANYLSSKIKNGNKKTTQTI